MFFKFSQTYTTTHLDQARYIWTNSSPIRDNDHGGEGDSAVPSRFGFYNFICMTLSRSFSSWEKNKTKKHIFPMENVMNCFDRYSSKVLCKHRLQYLSSQEYDIVSRLWNRWVESCQLKIILNYFTLFILKFHSHF